MRADPSLALQKVIRWRIAASTDVLALVPFDNIMDSNSRPEVMPCILIGEGHSVLRRFNATCYATIHIWFQEPGLVQAKKCASAIVAALTVDAQLDGPLNFDDFSSNDLGGFICHDLAATNTQFIRDPHGPYSHGIVTVAGIMQAAC
jgi:hypothetical protein